MLKTFTLLSTAVLTLGLTAAIAVADDEYRLDDGVGEQNFGLENPPGNPVAGHIAWLNRFTVEPGLETITDISIAWGSVPSGTPVDIYLWGDFNNDGDPDDAFVIESLADLTITNNGQFNHAFDTYDITDTTLNVGDYFYIGAIMQFQAGDAPAKIDFDGNDDIVNYPPDDHSWIAAGDINNPIDPNDMDNAQLPLALVDTALGQDGNWLIRANAIPAPGAIALLGLAGIAGRRRRAV